MKEIQIPEQATSRLTEEQIRTFKRAVAKMEFSSKRKRPKTIRYDIETIGKWLENPVTNEANIRNLSRFFYDSNALYRLIIRYMALMATYDYTIIPTVTPEKINPKLMKKEFLKVATFVDKLNLRAEMIKAMLGVFKEDVFYGYEYETEDSFFIQQLDGNYCRISSKEDGVYNYEFNFAFFDAYPDELPLYPVEFQKKYLYYKKNTSLGQWIELSSEKTICLKLNSEVTYPLPPFSTMFPALIDLDEYKAIKKAKAKNDNFMAVTQKIPMDKNATDINSFLMDLDLAMDFHQMAEDSLPEGVGVITSPMDIEAIKTEKRASDSDLVQQAYSEAMRDVGVSEFLFNAGKSTSVGLEKSIIVDETSVFSILRQIEMWVNRKLKRSNEKYKFKIQMLDITVFNRDEKHEKYLESAQYGLPVVFEIGATLGLSPKDLLQKITLEDDIFGFTEVLKPLKSSFNKLDEGGAPTKSSGEISDSGQVNRDRDTDANRG